MACRYSCDFSQKTASAQLRGNIHTNFVTQNVKLMMFLLGGQFDLKSLTFCVTVIVLLFRNEIGSRRQEDVPTNTNLPDFYGYSKWQAAIHVGKSELSVPELEYLKRFIKIH